MTRRGIAAFSRLLRWLTRLYVLLPAWYIRQHDNHDPDNKRRWMTNSLGLPRNDGQKAAAHNWYSYWCSSLTNDLTAGCRPSYKTISSDREWLLNMCFLIIYAFVLQLNRQSSPSSLSIWLLLQLGFWFWLAIYCSWHSLRPTFVITHGWWSMKCTAALC